MERLPNSSSCAYGPKTELSKMRACVPLGCLSTTRPATRGRSLRLLTGTSVRISTSFHHPFPPTCRYFIVVALDSTTSTRRKKTQKDYKVWEAVRMRERHVWYLN